MRVIPSLVTVVELASHSEEAFFLVFLMLNSTVDESGKPGGLPVYLMEHWQIYSCVHDPSSKETIRTMAGRMFFINCC